jgi:hypothetical protein
LPLVNQQFYFGELSMQAKEKHDELLAEAPATQQVIAPDGWPIEAVSWIEQRAYQIWQERGGDPGREMDDWLQAETEFEAAHATPEQAERRVPKLSDRSSRATAG